MRLIKKYPNRRLYDTRTSKFVSLEDIKRLILEHEDFKVVDSRSDDDLTRSVMLQIINELELNGSSALLTDQVLSQLIRFYGHSMQGLMREYLEGSLRVFLEQQDGLRRQFDSALATHPMNVLGQIAEQNLELWRQFARFGQPAGNDDDEPPTG